MQKPAFTLPSESSYVQHRQAQKRHEDTRHWLERRERALRRVRAPSLAPDHVEEELQHYSPALHR